MGIFWPAARKDLLRRLTDPLAIAMWVGIPLLLGGLLGSIGGGSGGTPTARVYWVDQDESFLSETLARVTGGVPVIDLVETNEVAGRARLEDGEGSALIVVPEGFGEALLRGTPAELVLVKNPAQRILPGIVEEGLEILVEAGFYLQELLGEELATMVEGPADGADFFPEVETAALSVQIQRRIETVSEALFPPVLDVEERASEEPEEDEEVPFGMGLIFLPGVLFMSLLFIAQGMSQDVWTEIDAGTLARLRTTPASAAGFLGGKVAAAGLLVVAVAGVALLGGGLLWGLSWAMLPLAILWCGFAGVALTLFFCALQFFAGSSRGGNVLTSVFVFPLMMIGGSFFPYEAMPDWMAAIGSWTPNGQGVVRLAELLRGEFEFLALLKATLAIGAFGAISWALASSRLRRGNVA